MTPAIRKILEERVKLEGGYVDNPDDPGGETKYGITVAVARANGWKDSMKDLPFEFAMQIYEKHYVTAPNFDSVLAVFPELGEQMIDFGITSGPKRAAELLQRLLNVFNMKEKIYPDIAVDGQIGPKTISCLTAFLRYRKTGHVLLKSYKAERIHFYISIAESRKDSETFVYGWVDNRVN